MSAEPTGKLLTAYCKCGASFQAQEVRFANGTFHAKGSCPKCGFSGFFAQRKGGTLEDLKHRLASVRAVILSLSGIDYHEGVAMLERLADELDRPEND